MPLRKDLNDDVEKLAAKIPAAADHSRANPSPLREALMGPGSVATSKLDESEVPTRQLEVCRIANQALVGDQCDPPCDTKIGKKNEACCEPHQCGVCHLQAGVDQTSVLKKMFIALAVATAFMLFQFVGGYMTGSIAIMTDAVHELSDALNYAIAIYATILTSRQSTSTYTFGYHRAETIGALINVVSICVLSLTLVMQAIERLVEPEPIDGKMMFIFAACGFGINVLLLLTMGHDHDHGHGHGHDHSHGHGHGGQVVPLHDAHDQGKLATVLANSKCLTDARDDISRDLSRLSASTITFNSQYGPGHQHATNVANQAIARVDSAPSSIRTMCTLQQEQYASSMAGSRYHGYHGGQLRSRRSPSSTGVRVPVLQAPSHVSQYTARRLRRYTAVAKALEKVSNTLESSTRGSTVRRGLGRTSRAFTASMHGNSPSAQDAVTNAINTIESMTPNLSKPRPYRPSNGRSGGGSGGRRAQRGRGAAGAVGEGRKAAGAVAEGWSNTWAAPDNARSSSGYFDRRNTSIYEEDSLMSNSVTTAVTCMGTMQQNRPHTDPPNVSRTEPIMSAQERKYRSELEVTNSTQTQSTQKASKSSKEPAKVPSKKSKEELQYVPSHSRSTAANTPHAVDTQNDLEPEHSEENLPASQLSYVSSVPPPIPMSHSLKPQAKTDASRRESSGGASMYSAGKESPNQRLRAMAKNAQKGSPRSPTALSSKLALTNSPSKTLQLADASASCSNASKNLPEYSRARTSEDEPPSRAGPQQGASRRISLEEAGNLILTEGPSGSTTGSSQQIRNELRNERRSISKTRGKSLLSKPLHDASHAVDVAPTDDRKKDKPRKGGRSPHAKAPIPPVVDASDAALQMKYKDELRDGPSAPEPQLGLSDEIVYTTGQSGDLDAGSPPNASHEPPVGERRSSGRPNVEYTFARPVSSEMGIDPPMSPAEGAARHSESYVYDHVHDHVPERVTSDDLSEREGNSQLNLLPHHASGAHVHVDAAARNSLKKGGYQGSSRGAFGTAAVSNAKTSELPGWRQNLSPVNRASHDSHASLGVADDKAVHMKAAHAEALPMHAAHALHEIHIDKSDAAPRSGYRRDQQGGSRTTPATWDKKKEHRQVVATSVRRHDRDGYAKGAYDRPASDAPLPVGMNLKSEGGGSSGGSSDSSHGGDSHGHGHGHGNRSLDGIILHILADISQSLGLTIAGAILWWQDGNPDWLWVDPACTFIFAFFVIMMTKDLLRQSMKDLMEAAPPKIKMKKLCKKLNGIKGVTGVHDLHVWGISGDIILMTAHINVHSDSDRAAINAAADDIALNMGITHSTVQLCQLD